MCVKLTVGRPVTSRDNTVYALLRPDLLAKCGDACICDERRVERIDAVPRRISRVRALCKRTFQFRNSADYKKRYVCPKYSTQRDCSASDDTKPISCVSPATGWHLHIHAWLVRVGWYRGWTYMIQTSMSLYAPRSSKICFPAPLSSATQ